MRASLLTCGAMVAALLLWGCAKPGEQDYFPPLQAGMKREYALECSAFFMAAQKGRLAWQIDGTQTINGKTYFKEVRVTTGLQGVPTQIRYLRRDEQGIHAINGNDTTMTEYLEVPFPVKVGNSWTVKSPDGDTRFQAEAIESLQVSGQKYARCLKVSYQNQNGNGYSYFAPAIGDVKGVIQAGAVKVEYALDKRE